MERRDRRGYDDTAMPSRKRPTSTAGHLDVRSATRTASYQAKRARLQRKQVAKLRSMLRAILPANHFYASKFASHRFDPRSLRNIGDLDKVPFTSKSDILSDQANHPPFGTILTFPIERYCRLHQSSGTSGVPLRWLDTPESWSWFLDCWGIIYDVVGLRRDDRLFFPFSFGPFLGFWGAFEGASRRGNLCLPGGGMTSAARLRFMIENRATVVACTPTYALHLAEVAEEEDLDLAGSPVRALVVAGEPGGSISATRARIESSWGVRVFDHTGMTEIGALGIECIANPGGVHMIESDCIAEVIDPDSAEPVEPGETGELVLTNLGRWGSPLIRYRTGDLVRMDPDPCPCGRPWTRLAGGILGRVDDMVIIRGNNIHPAAVEELLRGLSDVGEFRCTARAAGAMNSLKIEVEPASDSTATKDQLEERVGRAFQNRFHFRAQVTGVRRGSLPRFEMKGRRFVRESAEC